MAGEAFDGGQRPGLSGGLMTSGYDTTRRSEDWKISRPRMRHDEGETQETSSTSSYSLDRSDPVPSEPCRFGRDETIIAR
jgi:hypothetical protein